MREITQQHLELRQLQSDLAVKEAFITELRQARGDRGPLPRLPNSEGVVSRMKRSLSNYPRIYNIVRGIYRNVAGKPHE
jgi:hypothetical protein